MLHADISWPPSELIRLWSRSFDFHPVVLSCTAFIGTKMYQIYFDDYLQHHEAKPSIRTHTGTGGTVWQPILNLYNTDGHDHCHIHCGVITSKVLKLYTFTALCIQCFNVTVLEIDIQIEANRFYSRIYGLQNIMMLYIKIVQPWPIPI